MELNNKFETIISIIKKERSKEINKHISFSAYVSSCLMKNYLEFASLYNIDPEMSKSQFEIETLRMNAHFTEYLTKKEK